MKIERLQATPALSIAFAHQELARKNRGETRGFLIFSSGHGTSNFAWLHREKLRNYAFFLDMISFFIQPHAPRPHFRLLISFLWGDSEDVDTEGDAENPASHHWTELYCKNRTNLAEVFEVEPIAAESLTLKICSENPELAARVAYFLASATGSGVALTPSGPWQDAASLTAQMGLFDFAEALERVNKSRWRSASPETPYPKS